LSILRLGWVMITASLARRVLAELLGSALLAALVISPGTAQHLSPHDISQ